MLNDQVPKTISTPASRCDERVLIMDYGKDLSPVEKRDAEIKHEIANSLWKDNVLRTLDYDEIDVRVKNGVVYFNGHITNSSSQSRIENAIQAIPGIVEVRNNLVLDDKLTLDVATALSDLERTYHCKFFTGAIYGVISIGGTVSDRKIRSLAEKCASANPNTRGVINNIQVSGSKVELKGKVAAAKEPSTNPICDADRPTRVPCTGTTKVTRSHDIEIRPVVTRTRRSWVWRSSSSGCIGSGALAA